MNAKFFLSIAIVVGCATMAFAQDHAYYSDTQGTPNSDFAGNYQIGDTGSLFLYWDHNVSEMDTGAFLDIVTDTAGVIDFVGGETFEFAISVAGTPIGNRWTDPNTGGGGAFGPGDVGVDGQSMSINAFTVTGGDGIISNNAGPVFLDEGYDSDADAFLFARLDFVAVGNGTTNLLTVPGPGGIVNGGVTISNVSFGDAQITVGVPEPGAVGLLVLGLIGLVSRRQR